MKIEIPDIHGTGHEIDFENFQSVFLNCDCMEALRRMPDDSIELAIVDPPYGIGCMSMNYTKSGAIRTHGYAAATRRDYRKQEQWDIKLKELKELRRMSCCFLSGVNY